MTLSFIHSWPQKTRNIDIAISKAFLEEAALNIRKNRYLSANIQFTGKTKRET